VTPTVLADLFALDPLVLPAWRAATAAGAFLRDERPRELVIDTKSTVADAVTVMDRTAEAMIVAAILGGRPDDGFLGEEGGERLGTSGVRWVVDPLDGTTNYLYGLPMWGVSIGAEVDGVVQVGVVVAPDLDEAYVGVRGAGAWLVQGSQVTPLRCTSVTDLAVSLVATGFNYDPVLRERQAQVAAGLIPHVRDLRRLGAACVDLCWTARGRVDAFYERGLNAWDVSAGLVIAEEAGVVVSGLTADEPVSKDFMLAVAPGIAEALRARLVALAAAD
jgi:myo-inositol-1(or 4)-monophosphatase